MKLLHNIHTRARNTLLVTSAGKSIVGTRNWITAHWNNERQRTIFLVAVTLLTIIWFYPDVATWVSDKMAVGAGGKIVQLSEGDWRYQHISKSFQAFFGDRNAPSTASWLLQSEAANNNPIEHQTRNNKDIGLKQWLTERYLGKTQHSIRLSLETVGSRDTTQGSFMTLLKPRLESLRGEGSTQKINYEQQWKTAQDKTASPQLAIDSAATEANNNQVLFINQTKELGVLYTILPNQGVKEEIMVYQSQSMNKACMTKALNTSGSRIFEACPLPPNVFTFNLEASTGVQLLRTPENVWYFADEYGRYLGHFANLVATDSTGAQTNNLVLEMLPHGSDTQLVKLQVTVDLAWLLDPVRSYPVQIDPSVIYDESAEFANGTFDDVRDTGSGASPRIELAYPEQATDISTTNLYHFNNSWNDSSGYARNGSVGGAPTFTTPSLAGSHSANFDGIDDRVMFTGALDIFNGVRDTFTIEFWAKATTTHEIDTEATTGTACTSGQRFAYWTFGDLSNGGANALISMGTNGISVCETGQFYAPPLAVFSGNLGTAWHHIAVVYINKQPRIYLDGRLVRIGLTSPRAFVTPYSTHSSAEVNQFGIGGGAYGYFPGQIDEVRVSDVARSQEEIIADARRSSYGTFTSAVLDLSPGIQSLTSLQWTENGVQTGDGETPFSATGLVAQWNFNETSGTTTASGGACGATCNGTLTNFASIGSQDAAPITGWTNVNKRWGASALMFDGTNDYTMVADNVNLALSTYTISVWFKASAPVNASYVYGTLLAQSSDGNGYTSSYHLYLTTAGAVGARVGIGGTNYLNVESPPGFNDGQWHHISYAVISSGGTVTNKLYVDGILRSGYSDTGTVVNATLPFTFGVWQTGASSFYGYFPGVIDGVSLYNRELSSDEILSNYQAGAIEFQTRTGTDNSPDDGSWEAWSPVSGETSYNTFDSVESPVWRASAYEEGGVALTAYGTDLSRPSVTLGCSLSLPIVIQNQGVQASGISPVKLIVQYQTGMASDFSDLRFTLPNGNNMDWFRESYVASTRAVVWVDILTSETIHHAFMWYGGCTSGTASSEASVFTIRQASADFSSTQGTNGWNYQTWNGSVYANIAAYDATLGWWDGVNDGTNQYPIVDNAFDHPSNTLASVRKWTSTGSFEARITGTISDQNGGCGNGVIVTILHNTTVIYTVTIPNGGTGFTYDLTRFVVNGDTINFRTDANAADFNCDATGNDPKIRLRRYAYPDPQIKVIYPTEFNLRKQGSASLKISNASRLADPRHTGIWHFEETGGSGAYLNDSSGNGNNGTPVNTPSVVKGVSGNARQFNGSNQYISLTDSATLSPPAQMSISAWIHITDPGGGSEMIVGTDNSFYFGIIDYGSIYAGAASGNIMSNGIVDEDEWTHIAMTYDGTTLRVYHNGAQWDSTAATGAITDPSQIWIGASPQFGGTDYFPGNIDEVIISDVARTAEEIANEYRMGRDNRLAAFISGSSNFSTNTSLPLWIAADRPGSYLNIQFGEGQIPNSMKSDATQGFWHLDEVSGSGAYLKSSLSTARNGTPTNAPSVNGVLGRGRSFTADTSNIIIPDFTGLTFTSEYTVMAWINPLNNADYQGIAGTYNGSGWIFALWNDSINQLSFWANNVWINSGYEIKEDGQWKHVAFTRSGTTGRFYVNGMLVATSNAAVSSSDGGNMYIGMGGSSWNTQGFNGAIDEVLVLSSTVSAALSPDMVRAYYEASKRTHTVTVDFGARLDAGNLITDVGDTSFTVDGTVHGLTNKADYLYPGDTIIVRENYNGAEYVAQGPVSAVTASTGAVTVGTWNAGSTFPSGGQTGFSANADVFKWQEERISLSDVMKGDGTTEGPNQVNAIDHMLFTFTNGDAGRTVWVDDWRRTTGYLTDPAGSTPSSTTQRYAQFRALFTSSDEIISPWVSQSQLNFTTGVSNDLILRHGKWFTEGQKQPFWWAGEQGN